MRFSILGFNQEAVCSIRTTIKAKGRDGKEKDKEIRLDVTDLLIVQDIADFMNRNGVIKFTVDEKIFFAITHKSILQDLPILNIEKQALKDRLDKLCLLGVIEKKVIQNGTGTWVGYRMGDVYESLVYDNKSNWGVYQTTHGGCSKLHEGVVVNYTPNIDTTIKHHNNKINKEIEDKSSSNSKKDEHSIANVNSNNDDAKFIEEIYAMYPAKCPVRNTYLGKSFKDKNRIKTLLKQYSKDEIRKVVKYEVESKQGKIMLKNFSTFLNNFPDPNTLLNEQKTLFDDSNANPNDEMVINGQTYR